MKIFQAAAFVCFVAGLDACGGGGSSSPVPSSMPSPSPLPTSIPALSAAYFDLQGGFPEPFSGPIVGPDRNLWIVAQSLSPQPAEDSIATISTNGNVTAYGIPGTNGMFLGQLVAGSDGALWFPLEASSPSPPQMFRSDTAGNITTFPLPATDSTVGAMVSGSDGNLWYVAINVDSQGDDALRAFSPSVRTVVASLSLPKALGVNGPRGGVALVSNPKDGALLIGTSNPAGYLKINPGPSPSVSAVYTAPNQNGSIGPIAVGSAHIYGIYTSQKGNQQLLAIDESDYAVAYVDVPPIIFGGSNCIDGPTATTLTGAMTVGPHETSYLWGSAGCLISGDPHLVPQGFVAISPSGAVVGISDLTSDPDGLSGVALGPDGNVWGAVWYVPNGFIGRLSPPH